MIQLDEVTKLYKTVIGVNDINLSLEPGTYGLLGPNGSGKTTLINLILGQLRPTIGRVRLFGKNPWVNDGLLRRIGLCPALEVNYPRVSGLDWVQYLTQMHGFTSAEAHRRAVDAMEQVKMMHAMQRPMRNYSLGMRQRTKLAQAIAHDPDLLILDEPFNGLDPMGRIDMIDFLKSWRKRDKSLILASHILHEVEAVDPSFLLISGGRLLASGSPEHVRSILMDTPNTISIRCNEPRRLSAELFAIDTVTNVRVVDNINPNEPGKIEVDTLSAADLYQRLPAIVSEHEIDIVEMQAADESLKHLFSTLMRIHRGEAHGGSLS